ncbi:bifunctional DNA-formamidopyrimidine glycosylase/DNA-(apurinic or apyrimidinic site) lyase [Ancrocorticia populi]|uniref:DNA-formamidopyrimidine glycosylase n=1 Tax=Ancrocorticia populi TaxID=2175228 RepID=A0A2V1KA24_9ACTO|nr:bifunctional DNA-formamidopyrimidine glycosylase/DNA-(apurinic or apyrimidinic site) lyase [Ancrocorticia populi]PWF26517.1 DNA-formamidopyrimidine glycosylase [Ancrocorticia populi]
MPELPEVESVRLGLLDHVLSKEIAKAETFSERVTRRSARPLNTLAGGTLKAVARRGKFLWFDIAEPTGNHSPLVAHLGMSGQFRVNCSGLAHIHASLAFTDGTRLDFIDQRTFGYLAPDVYVPTLDNAAAGVGTEMPMIPHLVSHIARDLLDPHLDPVALAVTIVSKHTSIKKVLLDQAVISGIGNIYADEALFDAGIHPLLPANSLKGLEVSRLFMSATNVLERSLDAGGTSFDSLYVSVNGESGYFERSLNAYGRTGLPCRTCGQPIEQITVGGRSTHFCPHCQRRQ